MALLGWLHTNKLSTPMGGREHQDMRPELSLGKIWSLAKVYNVTI
jgi:hypothetical protein